MSAAKEVGQMDVLEMSKRPVTAPTRRAEEHLNEPNFRPQGFGPVVTTCLGAGFVAALFMPNLARLVVLGVAVPAFLAASGRLKSRAAGLMLALCACLSALSVYGMRARPGVSGPALAVLLVVSVPLAVGLGLTGFFLRPDGQKTPAHR